MFGFDIGGGCVDVVKFAETLGLGILPLLIQPFAFALGVRTMLVPGCGTP